MILRNFRMWWQRPRNISERSTDRKVSFLELFYDLVYVVLIAELTHALAHHVDLQHIAEFLFLFIITWWAWINGTAYHDLHGNNDIRTRVFTFLQMFTVAAMAVFAHGALGETSAGFALAYAGFQLILTFLWWRTGVHDPEHQPLSRPYALAFLITTLLFVASVFVEPPDRFAVWLGATLISIVLPLYLLRSGRRTPSVQAQLELSMTTTPSLVERFGLFTIIVLGEVIVGVVQGVTSYPELTWQLGGISALGMTIAFGAWWLYFDFVSHRIPRPGTRWVYVWSYAHLPVTAGIAIVGAAILNVIDHAADPLPSEVRWLLVGSIGTALVGIALLIWTLPPRATTAQAHRMSQTVIFAAAIIILALGFSTLETIPLLAAIAVLMLLPVVFGLVYWIKREELPA
ncbi:MAG: low temperature requirement protein A [Chloroflexi bacterium]|nr:low temperature requirement protein A [Chloroflexota bacterium]MCY4248040.1 low temperature requirement protein A [Chloroflexota bacterium]